MADTSGSYTPSVLSMLFFYQVFTALAHRIGSLSRYETLRSSMPGAEYLRILIVLGVSMSATAHAAPEQPWPVSPEVSAVVSENTEVTFRWQAVAGATSYDFYIWDRTLRSIVLRDNSITPDGACSDNECRVAVNTAVLAPAQRHVWRVAARDATGRSSFSHRYFDVISADPPDVPVAISPIDRTPVTNTGSFEFIWSEQTGADSYDFYVWDRTRMETSFRDRLVSASVCDGGQCRYIVNALAIPDAANHVWRVAARNSAGRSNFSHATFDTVSATPPTTPVPLAPAPNEAIVDSPATLFSWLPVPGATSYDLYVWDRTQRATIYRDREIDASRCDAATCTYTIDYLELPVAARHVWRVSARNSAGRSAFSQTFFDVVAVDTVVNQLPIANPGSDIDAVYQQAVTLDALASYDPDGTIEGYEWIVDGLTIGLDRSTVWTPSSTGRHIVTLTVTDDEGASSSTELQVDVEIPTPSDVAIEGYEYVWGDEFDGIALDASKWSTGLLWGPYLPINNEQQMYVDTLGMHSDFTAFNPFDVSYGTLKITSRPTSGNLQPPPRPSEPTEFPSYPSTWRPYPWAEYQYNGPTQQSQGYKPDDIDFLSGIITSYGNFEMTHGYVEARAKLPEGSGLWPAFWLLNMHYVEQSPEIDVMEFLGHDVQTLYNTYHYFDTADGLGQISSPTFTNNASDWTEDFHTFGLAWSPSSITWFIDGTAVHTVIEGDPIPGTDGNYRIPNQAMYLLANLAVGGNWQELLTGNPASKSLGDRTLEIDYIRAYKPASKDTLDLETDYELRFFDEFNGDALDASKWNTHFLWGPYLTINNEQQYYVDALGSDSDVNYSPFSFDNGVLSITAQAVDAETHEGFTPPATIPADTEALWENYPSFSQSGPYLPPNYTSGIITSYDAFKFAHGYAEMRARVPAGSGLWPAFWLLNGYYVGEQPEIDIMEVRGENPHEVVHSYHRRQANGAQAPADSATTTTGSELIRYSDDFHIYGLRWRHNQIDWYIDGEIVHSYAGDDVAYQVMYVIANLAVGGNFVSDEITSELPASLDIDYIRVYQEKLPNVLTD